MRNTRKTRSTQALFEQPPNQFSYFSYLFLFFIFFIFSPVSGADFNHDLIALGNSVSPRDCLESSSSQEKSLKAQENSLFDRLLNSPENFPDLIQVVPQLDDAVVERLINRVQFDLVQENRVDMKEALLTLRKVLLNHKGTLKCSKNTSSNIGGREVNLLKGEWNLAPDGKRFWVSSEYSDIILTPAEYRRYIATSKASERGF